MRALVTVAAALVLFGCAGNNVRWVKAGAGPGQFEMDKAQCEYEATLGTPGSDMGRGMGGAISSGITDGLRLVQLQRLCMQARGWQRTVVTTEAVPPPEEEAPPPPVVPAETPKPAPTKRKSAAAK